MLRWPHASSSRCWPILPTPRRYDCSAILAECERGEDSALAHYRAALEDKELPANLRETVEKQRQAIEAAHLRDELAPI